MISVYYTTNNKEDFLSQIFVISAGTWCICKLLASLSSQRCDKIQVNDVQNMVGQLHYFIITVCYIYWLKKKQQHTFPRFRFLCIECLCYSLIHTVFPFSCWKSQQTGQAYDIQHYSMKRGRSNTVMKLESLQMRNLQLFTQEIKARSLRSKFKAKIYKANLAKQETSKAYFLPANKEHTHFSS